MNRALALYTIYDHPTDYPDLFVVRRWFIIPGEHEPRPERDPLFLSDTLKPCRELLQQKGLMPMRRWPHDDPKIVETWI